MPFQIVRNDITNMQVDAIVNTANPRPVIGSGTDAGIHAKAGPELLQARQAIGNIRPGTSAITYAYRLQSKYVIHTVGPVWRGGLFGEAKSLRSCYDSALALAKQYNCQSIAFPLIATGNYGFPKDKALQIALAAFSEFLTEYEMQIYLVVFDRNAFQLSEKLFREVSSFIDDNYVDTLRRVEYPHPTANFRRCREDADFTTQVLQESSCAPMAAPSISAGAVSESSMSLRDMLDQADEGFTETLLKLIDRSGKKDSEIYNRANVSRQHFSKIRNNPAYKPTKPTAIAFAIALELDLDQTRDLIGRAGYALTKSSKFDLIIMYFISQRNYNLFDINTALFEFDQSLLGA